MLRLALVILASAALAACNKSSDADRSATGQVLEGTVSDAMLPVDTVTSEPPLAEPTEASGKAAKGHSGADDARAASDAADKPDTSATPAAEADAAPTPPTD